MPREVYEKIDDVRREVYELIDKIKMLKGYESPRMARYAYTELFNAFDTLAYMGENCDRARNTTENRPDSSVQTGYGGDGIG